MVVTVVRGIAPPERDPGRGFTTSEAIFTTILSGA
jgi:hypothetical protein